MKKIYLIMLAASHAFHVYSQANQALSNLTSPTAINASLLPATDNKLNLGSAAKSWQHIYLDGYVYMGGVKFISFKAGTGANNVGLGNNAINSNTTGAGNTAVGFNALSGNTYGSNNTVLGNQAMASTLGNRNTVIGAQALSTPTTFSRIDNVAIGYQAAYNGGNGNVAVGVQALYNATDGIVSGDGIGSGNAAIGNYALINCKSGYYNTAVGSKAGSNIVNGYSNTFIGTYANCGPAGFLNNSTAIGFAASITQSNKFVLGNSNVTGWGFGVESGNRAIKVGSNSSNGNGAYLTAGGTWTNTSARSKKEDFQKQIDIVILNKITRLEITRWKYKGTVNEYHYGPMADDFHRLFLVGDDSSISDMDKTGVLFLGMQALAAENTDLKKEVDDLKNMMLQMKQQLQQDNAYGGDVTAATQNNLTVTDATALQQNIPNPFTNTTTIAYSLPQKFSSAKIIITDKNGKQLMQLNLSGARKGTVHVDTSTLASGAYHYSLYVDEKLIGTKQMLLAR